MYIGRNPSCLRAHHSAAGCMGSPASGAANRRRGFGVTKLEDLNVFRLHIGQFWPLRGFVSRRPCTKLRELRGVLLRKRQPILPA
jgi:hypothetical protein